MLAAIQTYWQLSKPGITVSNSVAAIAGFVLATSVAGEFHGGRLLALALGIALVIASACTINNYIDREIDKKMSRTKKRGIVTGAVSKRSALMYAAVTAVFGFAILLLFTNLLTTILGLIAYVMYVAVYGIAKRTTIHSTLIGTIPGALPPAAGYVAVTGVFDMAALLLFAMMLFWQMPHFYAIAIFRRSDYQAAGLPIWSVIKGVQSTKLQMLIYAILFAITAPLLSVYGYTGYIYAIVMTIVGIIWVIRGLRGFRTETDEKWARKMFFFSLNVLLVMCLMIMVGGYLP